MMAEQEQPWWMFYPKGSAVIQACDQSQRFAAGMSVCLRDRPEKIRKIIDVDWHRHRKRYCYQVETEAYLSTGYCPAYWFEEQLELVETENDKG